jgi:CheY-like chemotaxis protein
MGLGAQRRILLVDDNTDMLEPLAELLRAEGYEVKASTDGPSALALVRGFDADVAVIDISLPLMDGHQLAAELRALDRAPRLIALSGYGRPSDKARSARAGFAVHLTKPVDLDRLLEAVSA